MLRVKLAPWWITFVKSPGSMTDLVRFAPRFVKVAPLSIDFVRLDAASIVMVKFCPASMVFVVLRPLSIVLETSSFLSFIVLVRFTPLVNV